MEAIQKITEEPLKQCPECKKKALEKQLSSGGMFVLKGEGFYKRSSE